MDGNDPIHLAERLLVLAGSMMEDLAPMMIQGQRNAEEVRQNLIDLLNSAHGLESIARCGIAILPEGGSIKG